MLAPRFTTRLPIANSRRKQRNAARRGAVACLMMWVLLLSLLMAAWVWNWNYLVTVNRSAQQRADILALAAAPALLDEDILLDFANTPVPDQTDDFVDAVAVSESYRDLNNQTRSRSLQLDPGDVRVTSGYVPDVTRQSGPFRFEDARPLPDQGVVPTPVPQHNTLYVECRRLAADSHPVRYLLSVGGQDRTADVLGGSFATLDNLVIGFRPTATANSPVLPIAILVDAWNTERPAGSDNHPNTAPGGNGICELQLRLAKSAADATDANAVLTFYDGSINVSVLTGQIAAGLCADDLPSGRLGPITATPTFTLSTPAIQWVDPESYPSLNGNLAYALNAVAISTTPTRVFPLYENFSGTQAKLVGFVAATVYRAEIDSDGRLTAIIEPCFIVNHTTWTASPNHASQPGRNTYIHKLLVSH